jgi:tripartite-type tricarboxylate transporter receptor subunit TctC
MGSRVTRLVIAALMAFACCDLAGPAYAQSSYPNRVVKILVGFVAGSSADILARIYAQKLADRFAQQFVVDNRAGAGGSLAAEAAVHAEADGYTFFMSTNANTFGQSAFKNVKFNFGDDLDAVALVASAPVILVVTPSLGVGSVKELIARARTSPGSVLYGSAGSGSGTHLAGELFNYFGGVRLVHVPYRGIPPALVDLLGGRLAAVFATAPTVAGYMADGRLKALAASTAKRSRLAPEVPTMAEAGLAGYETALWYGVVAPKGTPREIRAAVADALIAANALPDVQSQLAANGAEPLGLRLDAFAAFIRDDIKRMKVVVDYAGISVE